MFNSFAILFDNWQILCVLSYTEPNPFWKVTPFRASKYAKSGFCVSSCTKKIASSSLALTTLSLPDIIFSNLSQK